jgi:hypothetical protein
MPALVPSLFRKCHIDTMIWVPAGGFRYLIQARCSMSTWAEWRKLRRENARSVEAFIFEDILCRWGVCTEIVTDNGAPIVAAVERLAEKRNIHHIRVSGYNSGANGVVERSHRTMRDSIVKACDGDSSRWPEVAPFAFWADRVTVRKSSGHSPFFMAHGIEPLLPLDIGQATYLCSFSAPMSTPDLLALRARQLECRPEDLRIMARKVTRSRDVGTAALAHRHPNTAIDFDFAPGSLVLVRNTRIEKELNRKAKPCYLGPFVVARRTFGGSYRLAELDGALWLKNVAAFRCIPYRSRLDVTVDVDSLLDRVSLLRLESGEGFIDDAEVDEED